MSTIRTQHDAISRESLVDRLREELLHRAGDDRSICSLAAEQGIFCHGFQRFSDRELSERVAWLVRKRPNAPRSEIERLADCWQLARQEVDSLPTACDVQSLEHDLCNGWGDFSNDQLAQFYRELTGKEVTVEVTVLPLV